MLKDADKALLPEGLRDGLPPAAERQAVLVATLMATFASAGYQQVAPPLIEFEDSLLAGSGAAQARHMFRLMDPVSHRMMAVRADITLQVARIAATRLAAAPRPLRLSYAGPVLRVRGSQIRPEREVVQAGFELIGSPERAADLEVLLLAVEALSGLGISGLVVDITIPPLVPAVLAGTDMDAASVMRIRKALDAKDTVALGAIPDVPGAPLLALIDACGPADVALTRLSHLDLDAGPRALCEQLAGFITEVRAAAPDITLTIDAVESRGFEYYSGIGFALFAQGQRGELGRGGRYTIDRGTGDRGTGDGETAVGFTVYVDSLARAVPAHEPARRLYLPFGTDAGVARNLRAEGWRTVQGLAPEAGGKVGDAARRLGCGHAFIDGAPKVLEGARSS